MNRSMIDDLPVEMRAQLADQISQEINEDKNAAISESKISSDKIVS